MADNDSRTGLRYSTPAILDWVASVHTPQDASLVQAFATPEHVPAIMVGPAEGKLIAMLCRLAGVTRAVEVGTLIGYSAIHLARALPDHGHLWTIEFEAEHARLAQANLAAAGVADKVTVLHGAGVEVLPTISHHGPFDAVFLDADKVSYGAYARWALANLRPGGLILGDNAYLFGDLLDDTPRGQGMRDFHQTVAAACDSVCIPTPDGLVLAIKR